MVDILPLAEGVDVNAGDPGSGRTARTGGVLGPAYDSHSDARCDPNRTDDGDTALRAARFGHVEVVERSSQRPG